jgi:capsular polysaccharide transport system ATP-binding protein
MIRLDRVTKQYLANRGLKTVIKNASFTIAPGEVIGILGRNGAGKSTLVRLLSGAERPSSGVLERTMRVSWPLAFGGGFQGSLTGEDNIRFICRIYDANVKQVIKFVDEFAELGKDLKEPVKTYSTGMGSRLAFAISMAIDFDCYLIDEIIAVGDSRFHKKCLDELFVNRKHSAKVIVSHQEELIRSYCEKIAIIEDGVVTMYPDATNAIERYLNPLENLKGIQK